MPLFGSSGPGSRRAAFTRHLRKLRADKSVSGIVYNPSRIRCIGHADGSTLSALVSSVKHQQTFNCVFPFEFLIHKSIPTTNPGGAAQDAIGILFQKPTAASPTAPGSPQPQSAPRVAADKSNPLEQPLNSNVTEEQIVKELRAVTEMAPMFASTPQAHPSSKSLFSQRSSRGVSNSSSPSNVVNTAQPLLIVDLTTNAHGRDPAALLRIAGKSGAIVLSTTPDDSTSVFSETTTAAPSAANIETVTARMVSEVQVSLEPPKTSKHAAQTELPMKVTAGLIGPMYLRYTGLSGTELHAVDNARIKAVSEASLRLGGAPLVFFWNPSHSWTVLSRVIGLIGGVGGTVVLSKTVFINPLTRRQTYMKNGATALLPSSTAPNSSVYQGYDLDGVYTALQAGAYVGFTLGGSGNDQAFLSMLHSTGIKTPLTSKFWLTKSPVCSKTDALELLLFLSTVHPPAGSKWECTKPMPSSPSEVVQSQVEVRSSSRGVGSDCGCTERIASRILLSTGMAFRSDLKEQGSDGLISTMYIQGALSKIVGNKLNVCKNACEFLSFVLNKQTATTVEGSIATKPCHWCAVCKESSELYDKGKFSYCSMQCLDEHRKTNFSPKKKKT